MTQLKIDFENNPNIKKGMAPEEVIKLISIRITNEHRKHSSNIEEWSYIAAKKIYSQWFEFYQKQIEDMKKELLDVRSDFSRYAKEIEKEIKKHGKQ